MKRGEPIKRHEFAAVIYVSSAQVSFRHALRTVLDNAWHFGELHIVSPGKVSLNRPAVKTVLEGIRAQGITVVCHCSDDPAQGVWLREVKSSVLVRIPPLAHVTVMGMQTLLAQVDQQRQTGFQRHAIMPVHQLTAAQREDVLPNPWYGMYMLIFIVDWWTQLLNWFYIHDHGQHVCVEELLHGHERVIVPPHRTTWFPSLGLWPGDRSRLLALRNNCTITPTSGSKRGGRGFFTQMMQVRRAFAPGWATWAFVATVLYVLIGFPWWNPGGSMGGGYMGAWFDLVFNWKGTVRVGLYALLTTIHYGVLSIHFRSGWSTLLWPALFPLLIPIVFPLVLFWAKFQSMQDAFEDGFRATDSDDSDGDGPSGPGGMGTD
jgi:hypothetical protein